MANGERLNVIKAREMEFAMAALSTATGKSAVTNSDVVEERQAHHVMAGRRGRATPLELRTEITN